MNSRKNLAAQVAGAIAIAALVGTSAFAESRHSDATQRDHGRQSSSDRSSRHDRSSSQNQTQSRYQTAPQTYQRSETRSNGSWNRNESRNNGTFDRSQTRSNQTWNRGETRNNNRSFDRSQADSYRNNNRSFDRSQSSRNTLPSFDNRGRRSDFVQGRVSRFVHERGGYRIWVDGGRFPVWIPEARISLFPRLRVGLSLRFGGYYDPLGYLEAYDYYNDGGYYGGGYAGGYGGGAYSSGLLRGVVETVDYRRGTLVLRDDVSGSFVTALIRDRRLETLRPGDYAEIAGDWTRAGVFEGLRLEDSQDSRDTRDGRY
jgi:hypothetical protein